MSKAVKDWMMRDYRERLEGVEDALLISIRGIPANENNEMRMGLLKQDIRVSVVRNNLAKHVFDETPLAAFEPLLEGPSALAFGGESVIDVAREVMKWAKQIEHLELKGAVLEGELYEGAAGVDRLSKMPTREEALGQAVTLILSPAQKLVGAVKGPGGRLAAVIKALEEKLEKGEEIARVG